MTIVIDEMRRAALAKITSRGRLKEPDPKAYVG